MKTIVCPAWCVIDHAAEDDGGPDVFHHADIASIVPPASVGTTEPEGAFTELLTADLCVGSEPDGPPVILVNFMGHSDHGVDLDLAGADEMLAELDQYRAAFKRLRDHLAAESEQ